VVGRHHAVKALAAGPGRNFAAPLLSSITFFSSGGSAS
jgi:hypothetical protein